MDVLSDAMRAIRLEGALFLNGELGAPWGVHVPSGPDIARMLRPGARRLAICHLVLEGRCWIQIAGEPPLCLRAGEVVTLPRGDAHLLGSNLQNAAIDLAHMVDPRVPELSRLRYGGDGERTILVCGWFAYEGEVPDPLIASLPPLFTTVLRGRPAGDWIEQSMDFVLSEAAAGTPASELVASKVAEVLFAEALRGHLESMPSGHRGWLAGLRDPLVGRCLALMHGDPARGWTVESLAQAIHTSRSVLAERFAELVGMPPMQYLTRWRMVVAAGRLRGRHGPLARIARDVGYDSEAAFNRAFKREFGVAPGMWRRRNGATPADSQPSLTAP